MTTEEASRKWKALSRMDRSKLSDLALRSYKAGVVRDLLTEEDLSVVQREFIRTHWDLIVWLSSSVPYFFYAGVTKHLE